MIAFGNPPWQWQIAEKHGQTFVVLMDKTHQRNTVTPKILISEWTLPRHDILRVQLAKFLHGPSDKTHTADTSMHARSRRHRGNADSTFPLCVESTL